jgi:hypothetical protein
MADLLLSRIDPRIRVEGAR